MREWIEYHRLLGVEHFYLYENESTDNTLEVLKPYILAGLVEVIPWPNIPAHKDHRGHAFDAYQIKAFNHCIQLTKYNVQWLAVLDIDEYIVPTQGKDSLFALLNREARTDTGSLVLNWMIYGTSDVWKIPENKLLTETLTMRADDKHPWHALTKCLHKPQAVADCLVHEAHLKKGYKRKFLNPTDFRINHYWTRDMQECINKRCHLRLEFQPQNLAMHLKREALAYFLDLTQQFNRIEDLSIEPNLPPLRKIMFGDLQD